MSQQSSPSAIAEALSLDVQVLSLLLRRNCSQQRRSRYYHRLKMMIKCLARNKLNDCSTFDDILSSVRSEIYWIESMSDRDRRKRARGSEDQWTTNKQRVGSSSSVLDDDSNSSSLLASKLLFLSQTLTVHLPEVLSRILYAAEALYAELSRGYFVPFCTVAVASISRIRALLMRMGREGCVELGRGLSVVDDVLQAEQHTASMWHGRLNLTLIQDALYKIRQGHGLENNVGWGDWTSKLMDAFVEVDPVAHDRDQRARQRQEALRRGTSDVSSASGVIRSDADADICTDADDANFNVPMGAVQGYRREDNSDLGESVDIGGKDTNTRPTKATMEMAKVDAYAKLDANEQILQLLKRKKRRKTSVEDEEATGTDKPQKESIDDIFGSLDDSKDAAIASLAGGNITSKESKKKEAKREKQKRKKKKSKKRKSGIDKIFDSL